MNSSVAATLCDPQPCDHIVFSYTDDNDLSNAVTLFASAGLVRKEAVVLVVTAKHADAIRQRLRWEGFNIEKLQESRQLVLANAEDVLATFVFYGTIDEQKFKTGLGSMIDSARTSGGRTRPVRVFGEMVDLIWVSNPEATMRVEQLGNEVIESHSVTVLCAYSLGGRKPAAIPPPLLACHSQAFSMVRREVRQDCPNCGSTELVRIESTAIYEELIKCRGCQRIYVVKRELDGTTRLVRM